MSVFYYYVHRRNIEKKYKYIPKIYELKIIEKPAIC